MSDDFIPFNQSTPMQGKWQDRRPNQNQQSSDRRQQRHLNNSSRRGNGHNNRWNNSKRNSSFGSDSNSSFGRDKSNIDAYLHPAMLQDPWEKLRKTSQ